MALSAKQLGMAWINSKLEPDLIDPEDEEFQKLNGGKLVKPELVEKAIAFIMEDLAKMKIRYQNYVEKYVGTPSAPIDETPEAEEPTE